MLYFEAPSVHMPATEKHMNEGRCLHMLNILSDFFEHVFDVLRFMFDLFIIAGIEEFFTRIQEFFINLG